MKKLSKIFFLFLIISILSLNVVFAEEAAWPKTIENAKFTASIEGFDVLIYKTENKELTPETKTPLHTISLNPQEYTINPEQKERTIETLPGTIVKLNLNIDKEKLESLVKEKITTIENNEAYYIELVVKYKITDLKNHTYMYNYNLIDYLLSVLDSKPNLPKFNTNETVSQIFNIAGYYKEEDKETFDYSTTITEDNNLAGPTLNFAIFSNNDIKDKENSGMNDPTNHVLMFYDITNMEEILDSFNKITEETKDELENQEETTPTTPTTSTNTIPSRPANQVVEVDNTAFDIADVYYLTGATVILIGWFIILLNIERKEKKLPNIIDEED